MITIAEWLNPTRAVGLIAYGTAFTCCGLAWWRERNQRGNRRFILLLMVIEGLLLLDIAFDWRWKLHAFVGDVARQRNEYQFRHGPQLIALVFLAALLLLGLLATLSFFRRNTGARLAVSGVLLSVIVWCVEVVSLHQVDHIFYHLIGKWMAVSALWVLACFMVSAGMLLFCASPQPKPMVKSR